MSPHGYDRPEFGADQGLSFDGEQQSSRPARMVNG